MGLPGGPEKAQISPKLQFQQDLHSRFTTAFKIRSNSCVGEERRKGRRKRKEEGERMRKIERDRDRKDIGKDKRQWRSMEV